MSAALTPVLSPSGSNPAGIKSVYPLIKIITLTSKGAASRMVRFVNVCSRPALSLKMLVTLPFGGHQVCQ